MLEKVYTNDTAPFEFETYIAEKQKYTMCADFTKLKSKDATDCMKKKKPHVYQMIYMFLIPIL